MLTTQQVSEQLSAAGLAYTSQQVADLARHQMFAGAVKSEGIWHIPKASVALFIQHRKLKQKRRRQIGFTVVATILGLLVGIVSASKDGIDLLVGGVPPLLDPPVADPLSLDAELKCGLGCTTMNPEGWEPTIPLVALGRHNIDDQQYQWLIEQYGQGGILTFPMDEGAEIAPIPPSLHSNDETNACFKTAGPTLTVIARNLTRNENIEVMPLPILRVKSVEPLNHPVHTFYIVPEGVNFENYRTTLRPRKPGELLQIYAEEASDNVALHDLQPNAEPAALRIHFTCGAPGKYTLQLGIEYSYRKNKNIEWFDQDVIVYSPSTYYKWIYQQPNVGALVGLFQYDSDVDQWVNMEHPNVERWVEKE